MSFPKSRWFHPISLQRSDSPITDEWDQSLALFGRGDYSVDLERVKALIRVLRRADEVAENNWKIFCLSFASCLTASKFMILSVGFSLNWLSFCEKGVSRDSSQGWSILFIAKWLLLFSARPPFAVEPETGCNCNTTNPRRRTTVARAVQRQRWAWTKLLFDWCSLNGGFSQFTQYYSQSVADYF